MTFPYDPGTHTQHIKYKINDENVLMWTGETSRNNLHIFINKSHSHFTLYSISPCLHPEAEEYLCRKYKQHSLRNRKKGNFIHRKCSNCVDSKLHQELPLSFTAWAELKVYCIFRVCSCVYVMLIDLVSQFSDEVFGLRSIFTVWTVYTEKATLRCSSSSHLVTITMVIVMFSRNWRTHFFWSHNVTHYFI